MLLETAVADAYGVGFEFVDPSPDRINDLSRFYQHPKFDKLKPGQYTDDTQRLVANAVVMLDGDMFNADAYASAYIEILKLDPRDGYSRGYQAFLESTPDAQTFLRTIKRDRPTNGGLMGVAVLGHLKTPNEVILAASIQSMTTHMSSVSQYAAAVALSAHYFLYKCGPKKDLADYIYENIADWKAEPRYPHPQWEPNPALVQRTRMEAQSTFEAMLRGLVAFNTLSGIMHWAVECGGDTDSLAAVTVAVASCAPEEFENDIPQHLIETLEDGEFGRKGLIEGDKHLAAFLQEQSEI